MRRRRRAERTFGGFVVARQEIVTSLGKPGVDLQCATALEILEAFRCWGRGSHIFDNLSPSQPSRPPGLPAAARASSRTDPTDDAMPPPRRRQRNGRRGPGDERDRKSHREVHRAIAPWGVFGAPLAHSNDAEQAMRTALAISAAIPDLSARVGRPIGVAGGQVVASRTGSTGHSEYNVTGDTINLASHGCRRGRRNRDVGATAFRIPAIPRLNGSRRDDSAAFLGDYPAESGAMVPMVVGPDKLVGHLLLFGRQAGV